MIDVGYWLHHFFLKKITTNQSLSLMKIKFCGAAQTVTGSSHLVTLDDGFKILLDCGLYQGYDDDLEDFNKKWRFDPKEIDCVILSHSHIDHTGRIPQLVRHGFTGPIYATHATRDLCSLMLLDSAYIQVRDAEYINKKKSRSKDGKKVEPLYEPKDVPNTMNQFVSMGYEKWFKVNPYVEVLFRDAGHILGSANVTLRIQTVRGRTIHLGFSGDIGRPERPILRDPRPMPPCDYMICESTYGAKFHEGKPDEEEKLLQIIYKTCVRKKGKLLIPAFSVGRTQEIVHMLDRLETSGRLPQFPVYVDSPLSVNATEIFKSHPECFDYETLEYMLTDPNPFGFNNLHYIKKVEDSKRLNFMKEPCIIISASGMMTSGRIKHHVNNNIENPKTTILIVGYCAAGTLGGQLRDGKKEVRIFGETKQVKADVEVMDSFSAHGDQSEMIAFLDNQDRHKLKRVFLVHGEIKRQEVFKEVLEENNFKNVQIPYLGQEYRFDV